MFWQVSMLMWDPCFWFSSPCVQASCFMVAVDVCIKSISAVVISRVLCIFFTSKISLYN